LSRKRLEIVAAAELNRGVRQLLLATRNAHKTREFATVLAADFAVTDLTGRSDLPEVEETGSTFEENATLKAVTISRDVAGLVVADDSGLEVDALGGAPGVYSARYAGERATDSANVAKLLSALAAIKEEQGRSAQFRCVLALARGGELLALFDGVVRGAITAQAAGANGFGYDPIFRPEGTDRTFAELGADAKNAISHRARAIAKLRRFLESAP
jgi:XTP/dITP diphosphohydrolase